MASVTEETQKQLKAQLEALQARLGGQAAPTSQTPGLTQQANTTTTNDASAAAAAAGIPANIATGGAAGAPATGEITGDIEALVKRVAELEGERQLLNGKVENLSKKTKEKMINQYETQITEWLNGLEGAPPEKIEEFKKGLLRLAETTQEDSGIWSVVCCASAAHVRNVNERENMRKELDSLSQRVNGGQFGSEGSRMEVEDRNAAGKKRRADSIEEVPRTAGGFGWDDFSTMLQDTHAREGYTIHFAPQKQV